MATLPTNSTFLPVLDDLLSPDFRTVSLPGQTPQTPAETPVSAGKTLTFVESHTGQLTSKSSNYVGVKEAGDPSLSSSPHKKDVMSSSIMSKSMSGQMNGANVKKVGVGGRHSHRHSHQSAAVTIQQWWKVRKTRRHSTGDASDGRGVDMGAERAKHSIRHSRTEEHVRFLETEVHRLKSALATERKLRSLQVEAIKSLWSQVQKVTTASPGHQGQQDIMSQSMPNGLPFGNNKGGCMTMSVQGTLANQSQSQSDLMTCSCSKEIQDLKESFSSEVTSLRKMIDQLKVDGGSNSEDSKASKRPLTLNLSGNGGNRSAGKEESENVIEGKSEITGYAEEMASSIIEDAKEREDE